MAKNILSFDLQDPIGTEFSFSPKLTPEQYSSYVLFMKERQTSIFFLGGTKI